jgi:outer membrane protein TolC
MTQHVRNKLYGIACAMTVLLYGNAISQVDSSSAIMPGPFAPLTDCLSRDSIIYAKSVDKFYIVTNNARIFQRQMSQLEADVRANNPSLKSAAHRVESAHAMVSARASLDPPQVGVELYQAPVSHFPNPFNEQKEVDYSITQTIPFPGKLSLMANAEKSRAQVTFTEKSTLEREIIRDAKMKFAELYLTCRKLDVNAEMQDVVKNLIAVAQKQYELGIGKQSDILRAQTELYTLSSERIGLNQEIVSANAMLAMLRNTPEKLSADSIPEIIPESVPYADTILLKLAEQKRPELLATKATVDMRDLEQKTAAREVYPDFMIRGMYKQMIGMPDDWSLMLGVSLPVAPWSIAKYSSGVSRAKADALDAQEQLAATRNLVIAQVRDALAKVNASRDQANLYRNTILPQAQQTLQSALSSYMTGKEDFVSLIDAQRMLLSAKLEYHKAITQQIESIVLLEWAVGESLSGWQNEKRSN